MGRTQDGRWEELWRDRYAQTARLAGLLVGDRAAGEDLAQDAFARLVEAGDQVRDPAAYLRGTVVKLSRSHLRRVVVARRHAGRLAVPGVGVDDEPPDDVSRAAVRAALVGLPRRQREAAVLTWYAGLDEAGVAAAMGVSAGSVKTHLHRARAALRAALEEHR